MQHHSDLSRGDRDDKNIMLFKLLCNLFGLQGSFYFKNDDIGFYRQHVAGKFFFSKRSSYLPGMLMIFCKAFHMVLQCIHSGCCHITRLSHPPAKYFTYPPCFSNKSSVTDEDTADGATQSFIKTNTNAVK